MAQKSSTPAQKIRREKSYNKGRDKREMNRLTQAEAEKRNRANPLEKPWAKAKALRAEKRKHLQSTS